LKTTHTQGRFAFPGNISIQRRVSGQGQDGECRRRRRCGSLRLEGLLLYESPDKSSSPAVRALINAHKAVQRDRNAGNTSQSVGELRTLKTMRSSRLRIRLRSECPLGLSARFGLSSHFGKLGFAGNLSAGKHQYPPTGRWSAAWILPRLLP
jgi:hypothetical protein